MKLVVELPNPETYKTYQQEQNTRTNRGVFDVFDSNYGPHTL